MGLDKIGLTQNFKDVMGQLQADAKMIHLLADPSQRKNPKFVEDEVDKISDRYGGWEVVYFLFPESFSLPLFVFLW
jgi:hypothetical protein